MNIKLIKHEKSKSGYFFKHKALVEMTDVDIKADKEAIIDEVSIKVGYHPLGYGTYGGTISKSGKENQFVIVWNTGTHCD